MATKSRDEKDFKPVKKTGRTMNFSWMPQVNTEPKYPDPWRPGKLSVFDLSKKLTDVLGDMVIYHCRLLIAKHRAMDKMDEDTLMEYFSELQTTAYEKTWKGFRNWKPSYGLNVFVQNQVRFTAMTLKSIRDKQDKKGLNPVLVPSETVSDMAMTFEEAMAMAELYTDGGNDDQAAKIYEKICLESSVEEDEAN